MTASRWRRARQLVLAMAMAVLFCVGCSHTGGRVRETDEYSFDAIAGELAAEEAASQDAAQ